MPGNLYDNAHMEDAVVPVPPLPAAEAGRSTSGTGKKKWAIQLTGLALTAIKLKSRRAISITLNPAPRGSCSIRGLVAPLPQNRYEPVILAMVSLNSFEDMLESRT